MDIRRPEAGVEHPQAGPFAIRDDGAQTPTTPGANARVMERLPRVTMARATASVGALTAIVLMIAAPDLPRPGPQEAAAVLILFLALWVTKTVSDHLAAIIFFIAAVSVIGVPPEIALSGFHSDAVWLVLGGLIVGAAIKSTGFGERLAMAMLSRSTRSYPAIIVGAVAVGAVLTDSASPPRPRHEPRRGWPPPPQYVLSPNSRSIPGRRRARATSARSMRRSHT